MPNPTTLPFHGSNQTGGIASEVARLRGWLARIKAESSDLVARAMAAKALGREKSDG